MSTVTVVATVEANNYPPRVRLDITDSGTPAINAATVTRLDADGRTVPVRTADGGPLPLTVSGSTRVGLLYDYEMPFGMPVSYSTLESPTTSSAQVAVDTSAAWLVHPGVPALSVPIVVQQFGSRVAKVSRGVFYPMGRATAVVVTDGTRKAAEYDLTLLTLSNNERAQLGDVLGDGSPLLLNVPFSKGWGVGAEYIAVGDIEEGRVTRLAAESVRTWKLPCTVVDRPAGGSQSLRTYTDVLVGNATYATVMSRYPSYAALLAGP